MSCSPTLCRSWGAAERSSEMSVWGTDCLSAALQVVGRLASQIAMILQVCNRQTMQGRGFLQSSFQLPAASRIHLLTFYTEGDHRKRSVVTAQVGLKRMPPHCCYHPIDCWQPHSTQALRRETFVGGCVEQKKCCRGKTSRHTLQIRRRGMWYW